MKVACNRKKNLGTTSCLWIAQARLFPVTQPCEGCRIAQLPVKQSPKRIIIALNINMRFTTRLLYSRNGPLFFTFVGLRLGRQSLRDHHGPSRRHSTVRKIATSFMFRSASRLTPLDYLSQRRW